MISQEVLQHLYTYILDIHDRTSDLTIKDNPSHEELLLTSIACLSEETGELSAEVRKMLMMSFSKKKVDAFDIQDLENEAVDVLIVLLLILKQSGIQDINEAIARKIGLNNERGY